MNARTALLLPVALALTACATTPPPAASSAPGGPASASTGGGASGTVSCEYRATGTPAKQVDPPSGDDVPATGTSLVTIRFTDAEVQVELDRAAAPCTVHSFESLAAQGWFNDTECHRLSTTGIFILQCGDPTGTGRGGPGYTFDDELAQTTGYPAGVLAMANAGPDTNGSQFFFVYDDTPLPPNYTVFGRFGREGINVIADKAFQGHDGSYPDGTGRPNAPTGITAVVAG